MRSDKEMHEDTVTKMLSELETPPYIGRHLFKMCDTPVERIIETKAAWIDIQHNYIRYHISFVSQEKDSEEDTEWKDNFPYNLRTVMRSNISGVVMYFHKANALWTVRLDIAGAQEDIVMFFQEKKDARSMYDKIDQFLTAA